MRARSALCALLAIGVAAPVSAQKLPTAFDVTSVKRRLGPGPNVSSAPLPQQRTAVFTRTNTTAAALIQFAFDVRSDQVVGGPDWIRVDRFDVEARAAEEVPIAQIPRMVRSLLEDRFGLMAHFEQREGTIHSLVLARNDGQLGPALRRVDDCTQGNAAARILPAPPGAVRSNGCGTIAQIARSASRFIEAPVNDETGLTGLWEYSLHFSRESLPTRFNRPSPADPGKGVAPDTSLPSYATALREQLGLEIKAERGRVDVLVIDSIRPPTDN